MRWGESGQAGQMVARPPNGPDCKQAHATPSHLGHDRVALLLDPSAAIPRVTKKELMTANGTRTERPSPTGRAVGSMGAPRRMAFPQ